MKKKVIATALAVSTVLSALAGCGDAAVQETTSAASQEATESPETEETGEETKEESDEASENSGEKETLVIGIQTNSYVTDYKDNYLTKLIEEDLNVNLEFYQLPSSGSDANTKISLMATNGEDMPDVLMTGSMSPELVQEYGSQGLFIPLNDYLTQEGTNYQKIDEADREIIERGMTSADGNIYALPNFCDAPWNFTPNRLFINTAWLDKLGLEIPETTDELYEVLKAFHDNDPNGNGQQDEIGVYGYASGTYGQNVIDALMNGFVFYNGGGQNGGLALDESGEQVIAPFATEEWKAGLTYLNKLYQEGLLASSIFTDDDTQFKATLNADTNIVGLVSAGSTSNWTDCDNNPNFLEMDMIPPLTGPDGVCYTPYSEYSPQSHFFITSACENPDLAYELGDWFLDYEHSRIARFGEKGVDWTDDPETCDNATNAYKEAGLTDTLDCVQLTNIWSEPSNKFWHNVNPYYESKEASYKTANGLTTFDESSKSGMLNAYNIEWYADKHPEKVLPLLHYTQEESDQCSKIILEITELVEQAKAEFIIGDRNLEDGWDAYLQELNNMGLETWLAAAQQAYERGMQE